MLVAYRVFGGRLLRRQVILHGGPDRREPNAVLAHAMQQLHDVGDIGRRCQRSAGVSGAAFDGRHMLVGRPASRARLHRHIGETPEVFNQRELQHAGPGPQFANRQRSDTLIAVDEHGELMAVDPAVAVTHQFDRHGVDSRVPRLFARGQRGKLSVIRARQVAADVGDLCRHQMVVVEQPFGRGGDELSGPDVVGQRTIGGPQDARVLVEAREDVA